MIKFFRKIRQRLLSENKVSKYLIYAIGEIVLVVIGILIAIGINKWNENKIQHDISKEYLTIVNDEIITNIEYMSAVYDATNKEMIQSGTFIKYLNPKDTTQVKDSIINTLIDKIGGSSNAKIASSAIKDYINSGTISSIKSRNVRKRLLMIETWYETFERYNVEAEEEWDNHFFPYLLKNSTFTGSSIIKQLADEIEIDFKVNRPAFIRNKEFNNLLLNHLQVNKKNEGLMKYWIEALKELSSDIEYYLENY